MSATAKLREAQLARTKRMKKVLKDENESPNGKLKSKFNNVIAKVAKNIKCMNAESPANEKKHKMKKLRLRKQQWTKN